MEKLGAEEAGLRRLPQGDGEARRGLKRFVIATVVSNLRYATGWGVAYWEKRRLQEFGEVTSLTLAIDVVAEEVSFCMSRSAHLHSTASVVTRAVPAAMAEENAV